MFAPVFRLQEKIPALFSEGFFLAKKKQNSLHSCGVGGNQWVTELTKRFFFSISLIKSRGANEAPSRYNPQDEHYCNAEYLNEEEY